MNRLLLTVPLSLSLAFLPWLASAGSLRMTPAAGNYADELTPDSEAFTDAMHNRLAEPDAATVRASRRAMSNVRREIDKLTLARFEYTYMEDGIEKTLVLHGRSGKPLETIFEDAKFTASKSGPDSGINTSTADSTGEENTSPAARDPYRLTGIEIERDRGDARFFPADSLGSRGATYYDVRAPRLPQETSHLIGDGIHGHDAELMNLRYYEREIEARRLPREGKLRGVVSKTPCESCQTALSKFATDYDVDIRIHYLVEPGAHGNPLIPIAGQPMASPEDIQLSRAASERLKGVRRAYSRTRLSRADTWQAVEQKGWTAHWTGSSAEAEGAGTATELCE